MLSRIFEPFVQAETSTSRRFGGTGLGTSIAKQLVALMGGTLQVESKENEGSRFWFEIELPVCTRPEEVNSPSTDSSTNPAEPNAVPHGKRILVADDNETNLQILKAMLDRDAHTVVLTPDGSTALVALNESEFDLALLDYNLGDQTGLDVMKAYRMGRLRTCPILFLTADATSETSRTLVDAGASGVLTKPISLDALRSGIREALASGRCTAPIRQPSYTETAPALALVKTNILDDSLLDRLRLLSSDPDFFPNLVRQSASEIAHYSKESQEAIRRRDFAKLRFSAHTLKGVAHNVGAVRLSSQAKRLMQAESANDGRDWPNEIAELAEETERVLNALSGLCAGEPVT
jgi:two-component system sensor histidine kinase RpfC